MIEVALDLIVAQGGFTLAVTDRASVEVLGLFGPSGSGKTTLLETIAGLRQPARGEIRIGDRVLFSSAGRVDLPAHERRIGYVPQDALLFPHLDVRGNLEYGAGRAGRAGGAGGAGEAAGAGGRRESSLVVEVLELARLLDRRVGGLSGGEKQRVAIGRALMTAPALLLLDEPLAAVDREHRDRILPYLLRIRRELHVPMIYVTHDAEELGQIADRVLVMGEGRVRRAGAPPAAL